MGLESKARGTELDDWVDHLKQEGDSVWARGADDILVLYVLEGPGVGKGTQCAKIARDFEGVHISVGDLLREEAKSESSLFAEFIDDSIRNSVIMPAELTIKLLRNRIDDARSKGKRTFIIDGFPRSLEQARAFEEKIHDSNITLFLQCSEATMLKRLESRATTSGRIDDNPETVLKRLQTFSRENSQVEEYLRKNGKFYEVEASRSVEEVYSSVKDVVDKLI